MQHTNKLLKVISVSFNANIYQQIFIFQLTNTWNLGILGLEWTSGKSNLADFLSFMWFVRQKQQKIKEI